MLPNEVALKKEDWKFKGVSRALLGPRSYCCAEYQHRDQTSIWGESNAGPPFDLDNEGSYELMTVKKFKYCGGDLSPDQDGVVTFPASTTVYQKKFVLCEGGKSGALL